MLYAFISEDIADSLNIRMKARPAHLARLNELQNQGRLVLAGPHPKVEGDHSGTSGFSGSLIVAEFESFEEAQQWGTEDPYLKQGVYAELTIKPFKQVLP